MEHLVALHKHWCTADAVKQVVGKRIEDTATGEARPGLVDLGNMFSMFARLSVWYALLYVVIEGYKELALKDPVIDEVLNQEEYINYLRLFRNATFHFQADPLTEKALKFLEATESENWIRELNSAFERFFVAKLPIREALERLKGVDVK